MSKLIQAQDILADAHGFIWCMWMAAPELGEPEQCDPLQWPRP